jgi:hypothetical protein
LKITFSLRSLLSSFPSSTRTPVVVFLTHNRIRQFASLLLNFTRLSRAPAAQTKNTWLRRREGGRNTGTVTLIRFLETHASQIALELRLALAPCSISCFFCSHNLPKR